MNLDFIEKVLGFDGPAFVVFGSILLFFYKLDDFLSDSLRDDIALWLMLAKPPRFRRRFAFTFVIISNNLFGKRLLSLRAFFISSLISTALYLVLSVISMMFLVKEHSPGADLSFNEHTYFLGILIFYYVTFGITASFIIDYASLCKSRTLLKISIVKNLYTRYFILDVILTAAIALLGYYISLLSVFFLVSGMDTNLIDTFGWSYLTVPFEAFAGLIVLAIVSTEWTVFVTVRQLELPAVFFPSLILILTTFFTTAWILLATISAFTMRLLSKSGSLIWLINRILPVDTKPMRSIGVLAAICSSLFVYVSGKF